MKILQLKTKEMGVLSGQAGISRVIRRLQIEIFEILWGMLLIRRPTLLRRFYCWLTGTKPGVQFVSVDGDKKQVVVDHVPIPRFVRRNADDIVRGKPRNAQ